MKTIRMAIIKKAKNNKCWQRCGEKGNYWFMLEYKLVQPLWKTAWRFLNKLQIELPHDPAIPPLSIYLKNMKTLIQKDMKPFSNWLLSLNNMHIKFVHVFS
uniref:Uncharacterized protein n=1 Tax=Sus scrofa TaxID=9823 RepID=A0A8D1S852_PIG